MNAYETKRREELGQLLVDPERSQAELLDELSRLVEREVRSAYRRGIRNGHKMSDQTPTDGGRP